MADYNQKSLGDAIQAYLEYYRLRSGIDETDLRSKWAEIMGPSIAKHTTAINLKEGKLYLRLDNSALRSELQFMQSQVVEKINDFYKRDLVKSVHLG